jgi:hypothetical protein
MFFHLENQKMLWQTLQKSPYFVEFGQKYAGHKESWFRGVSEQFYGQCINRNERIPSSAKELLEMNKNALAYFVADLKRLLGYGGEKETRHVDPLVSYNVGNERQMREEKRMSEFSHFQEEYGRLLQRPGVPDRGIPSESAADQKIKNMDELLAEHAKMRDMDLSIYAPKALKAPSFSEPTGFKAPSFSEPTPNSIAKLKILD